MDAKRLARSVDRGVLSNPWVSRAGNATFLGGVAVAIYRVAKGTDPMTVLTLVLIVVGVALMAAPPTRRWIGRRTDLGKRSRALGDEITRFAWERHKSKPLLDRSETPEDQWVWVQSRQMAHDLRTKELYESRFGGRVFRLVRELRSGGHVQPEEVTSLTNPPDVGNINWVGERLSQLGAWIVSNLSDHA